MPEASSPRAPAERRTVDVAALIDSRRLTRFNYALVALSWLITLFDGFDQMMIGFTAPYIRDEFHLTKAQIASITSSGIFGMMIGGFIFSVVADRIGRRPTVVFTAFAFGVLTAATALAQSVPMLIAFRFLDGLAIGGMLPLAWALNIEFVPKRFRATIVTIIMMGYSAGSALAGPLTNLIAPVHGWRGVYLAGGVGTLVCATALMVYLPESLRFLVSRQMGQARIVKLIRRVEPTAQVSESDRFILGDEVIAEKHFSPRELFIGDLRLITPLIWLAYTVSSLAVYFTASWGPLILEDLHVARSTAALVSASGGMLGACAGLAIMRVTDRFGPISVAIFPALAVPALLLLGLGLLPAGWLLPAVVVGGIFVSGGHFGILSICGIYYPSAIRASGAGWATSVAKVGGVMGPIAGALVLSSGLPVLNAYAVLAVCPVILGLSALAIARVVARRKLSRADEAEQAELEAREPLPA